MTTQPSCDYVVNVDDVKLLREKTGAGMFFCKQALEKFGGDLLLAEGYLLYQGKAIAVWKYDENGLRKPDNEAWTVRMAHKYKQDHLTKPNQANTEAKPA